MSVVRREKSKLFTPLALADGTLTLKHRIAMAPLTRKRSPNHVPTEMVGQYYEQRASDGGLLISEGTLISPMVPPPPPPAWPGVFSICSVLSSIYSVFSICS